MPYTVLLHSKAMRALRGLPSDDRVRVKRALRALEADPFRPRPGADIKRLRGTKGRQDLFRLRAGRYRAVYAVVGNEVLVTDLFERGAGYDV